MSLVESVNKCLKSIINATSNGSNDYIIVQIYKCLEDNLQKINARDIIIEEATQTLLVDVLHTHICNGTSDIQLAAFPAMIAFLKCKNKDFELVDIHDKYFYLAFGDPTKITEEVQNVALSFYQLLLFELITRKNFPVENIYQNISNAEEEKKFGMLLQSVCSTLPVQDCVFLFYETLIPLMFSTDIPEFRIFCRNLVSGLQPQIEISIMNHEQLNTFKTNLQKCYIPKIKTLQDEQSTEWGLLCSTLVHCCGKMLLTDLNTMNLFLKVTQTAFHSGCVSTYIQGYDCWTSFIDVYSLDLNYLYISKHLQLIITPLRINITKNAVVTHKRLKLWLHLISVLKQKAIDCIQHFLNFCFGPLSEAPFITLTSTEKQNPGRLLWQETTSVLLEIMGHSHDTNESCFQYCDGINFKLEEPIITCDTFGVHGSIIINAIGECSLLLFKCPEKTEISKTIRCLWNSLFTIIKQLEQKEQDWALEKVTLLLAVCIQANKDTSDNLLDLLKLVIDLLLDKLFFPTETLNKVVIYPLVKNYIKHGDLTIICNDDLLVRFFCFGRSTSNSVAWFERACEIFNNVQHLEQSNNLLRLWVEVLPIVKSILSSKDKTIQMESALGFIIWPLLRVHELSVPQRKDSIETWYSTFKEISKEFPDEANLILQKLQSHLKEPQAQNSGVIFELFPYFCTQLKESSDSQFLLEDVLKVASEVFTLKIDVNTQKLLLPTLKEFLLCLESTAITKASLEVFCYCCENAIIFQQMYEILEVLVKFFEKIPKSLISVIPSSLLKSIRGLITHENKKFSRNAALIVAKFGKILMPSPKPISRAAKITSMARINSEIQKGAKRTSYGTLFDVKTNSPERLRGSLLNGTTMQKKEKTKKTIINKSQIEYDNEEANFVLIDEQYKFDPDKLSDHQLEKLKERRSDIPALYQDLSQSQSGSQCLTEIIKEARAVYMKKDSTDSSISNDEQSKCVFQLSSLEKLPLETGNNGAFSSIKPDLQQSSPHTDESNNLDDKNSSNKIGQRKRRIPLTRVYENLDQSLDNKILNNFDSQKIKELHDENNIQTCTNQNDTIHNGTTNESEENFKLPSDDSLSNIDTEKNIPMKSSKLSRELNKIKIDIVGGDAYLQNLDLSGKRKTRKTNVNAHPGHIKPCGNNSKVQNGDANDSNKKMKPIRLSTDKSEFSDKFKENLSCKTNDKDTVENSKHFKILTKKKRNRDASLQDHLNNKEQCEQIINVNDESNITAKLCSNLKEKSMLVQDNSKSMTEAPQSEEKCSLLSVEHESVEKMGHGPVEKAASCTILEYFESGVIQHDAADCSKNTEDVIESSQESLIDITLCKNTSTKQITLGTNVSEEIVVEVFTLSPQQNCYNLEANNDSNDDEITIRNLIDNVDICSPDELIRLNLASNNKASINNNSYFAEMDTETAPENANSEVNEIPTSPVYADTPTRTKDLLENTINISPIRLFPDSDENQGKAAKTPDLFDSELCVDMNNPNTAHLNEKDELDICNTESVNRGTENLQIKEFKFSPPSNSDHWSISNSNSSARQLLRLLSRTLEHDKIKHKTEGLSGNKYKSINLSKSGRIVKIMEKCVPENNTEFLSSNKEIDVVEIVDSDEEDIGIPENRILRFVREIPSPMASPKRSILKRKAPDEADEGLSPPKKKRVNFPDPPLTSQRLIIKDSNEHAKPLTKLHNMNTDPVDAPMEIVREEIVENADEQEIPNRLEVKVLEDVEWNVNNFCEVETQSLCIDAQGSRNSVLGDANDMETESLNIETQGSIDCIQTHLLEQNKPICPELVDCKESVEKVMQKITSIVFTQDVLRELRKKHIFTVGDLARLPEVEINRLPFIHPKIKNVQNALTNYLSDHPVKVHIIDDGSELLDDYKMVQEKYEIFEIPEYKNDPTSIKDESTIVGPASLKSKTQLPISMCSLHCTDDGSNSIDEILHSKYNSVEQIRTCFEEIISKAKKKGLQLCLGEQLVEIVGVDVLLSVLINSGELFKEESIISVLNAIIENLGSTGLLHFVLKLPNFSPQVILDTCLNQLSEQDAATLYIKLVNSKLSINQVLQKFGVEHIIDGLHYMQQDSQFSLSDFFNSVTFKFRPSVQDIALSFRNISVVNVNGKSIGLKSLEQTELNNFVQKVLSASEDVDLFQVVPKHRLLTNFSCSELVGAIEQNTSCNMMDKIKMLLSKLPNEDEIVEPLIGAIIEKYSIGNVWQSVVKVINKHFNDCQSNTSNTK